MHTELGLADASLRPSEDDATLLSLIHSGDEQALAALYDRYARTVYSVALRVLRDAGSAEELLEELFLDLWRMPGRAIAVRGSLCGWLTLIARNRSIDVLHLQKPLETIDDLSLSSPYDLSAEAIRATLSEKSRAAVQQLPVDQRKALETAFFDGLTPSEIAELNGEPAGASKTRITAALASLRKALLA